MPIPASFDALVTHAAPGLHFPPYQAAERDECVLPAPHQFGRLATPAALETLRKKTAPCPELQAELLEFYSRWNGVGLCAAPDLLSGEPSPALNIHPLEEWDGLTAELLGDLGWMLDGLEDMYVPGRYVVFASSPSEDTRLVLFVKGSFEGQPLAGKVFYLWMDPVLSFTEPIAHTFFAMLGAFAREPAAFLGHIGYTHPVMGKGGVYGVVPDEYAANCGPRLDKPHATAEEEDRTDLGGGTLFD
jgi:hypothetical protein